MYMYIPEVMYCLCVSKPGCPGNGGAHSIVFHLLGSSSQFNHVGEMYDASSRVKGTRSTSARPTSQVSSSLSESCIRTLIN